MPIVVTQPAPTDPAVVDAFGRFGVATVHEAQGRTGLLARGCAPIYAGARVAGTARHGQRAARRQLDDPRRRRAVPATATCSSSRRPRRPRPATSASCSPPRCRRAACAALVIDAGCRDVAELTADGLPGLVGVRLRRSARSRRRSAASTCRVVCAGQLVEPGDVVVADDDGVVVVPRGRAAEVLEASRRREEKEAASRERYAAGELSLDVNGMRERLAAKGLVYVDAEDAR